MLETEGWGYGELNIPRKPEYVEMDIADIHTQEHS